MATAAPEVPEAEAEGKIKGIYDEIKETLRAPTVSLVFRVLATEPDYLQLAWKALKPNVQTAFFEARADELRRMAVDAVATWGGAPAIGDAPEVADAIRVFHYLDPKLLLAVGALRAASTGQQPRLVELPLEEKRQIKRGVPPDMPRLEPTEHDSIGGEMRTILGDIRTTLGVHVADSEYEALARWPSYLTRAWAGIKPLSARPEFSSLVRDLRRARSEAIVALPFRMDIGPHWLRRVGLSEVRIDRVHQMLRQFDDTLPGTVASMAYLAVGALGRDRAAVSPYPADVD
jgi:hypothetical protein